MMSVAVMAATNTSLTTRTSHFVAAITAEVETHLNETSSASFQARIASQQSKFAASIAKAGGSYVPASFQTLVTTATADKAAARATTIAKEIAAFTSKLIRNVHNHPQLANNAHFQAQIANAQTKFAAKIARQGGTYTPIQFFNLPGGSGGVGSTPATVPTLTSTVPSSTEIDLSWSAIPGAVGYTLEKSLNGTVWTTVANPTGTSFNNYNLSPATSYQFRISTVTPTSVVGPSAVITVSTLLLPPANLAATAASATSVNLTWSAVSGATAYSVQRSLDGNSWSTLAASSSLNSNSTSLTDSTALAGTSYFYRIAASNSAGTSAASSPMFVTTLPAQPVLTGTPISATEIDLSWVAIPTAFSYKVESSLNGIRWSTLATQSGTTFNHTSLTADSSHSYRVSAISAAGTSATSAVVTRKTFLAAPLGLSAVAASTTSIGLSWIPSTDATGYKLERSTDNTIWTAITPGSPFTSSSVSYTDTALLPGTTYYYRLSAISTSGTSVPCTLVSTAPLTVAPTVTGTATSATAISLSWPAVTGATGYEIDTTANNGVTWSTLVASQNALTYSQSSLLPNTAYKYRVTTLSANGPSQPTSTISVTTAAASPASLGISVTSATAIHLSWALVPGATGYKLERSLNSTTGFATISPIAGLGGSIASYDDTSLTAGTTYYYRLSALQGTVATAPTAVVSALTDPAQPVVTTTAASSTAINVSWIAIPSASSYTVEVSANGGSSWTATSQAGITYAATNLTPDASYQYRITAVNGTGNSVVSAVATQSTLLTSPTNLSATSPTATSAVLIWTPVIDATNYKLERSPDNSHWTTLTTSFNGSSASFTDSTVTAGTQFYYRLSAIDAAGTSVATAVVPLLTLPAAPPAPTGVVVSSTALTISWTAVTGATSYLLETSPDGTTWTTVVTQATLSDPITSLNPDTTYHYRVTAINNTGHGVASAGLTLKTSLGASQNFTATVASPTSVNLAWTANSDVASYLIQRAIGTSSSYSTLTQSPALTGASSTFTDTTALAGTSYSYRISGINTLGTSAPSTAATVLTLPATPVLTAVANSISQITLGWPAVQSATGYKLEYSADNGATWTTLSTANVTTYVQSSLIVDTTYKYRITTINGTGNSTTSTPIIAATLLATPTGFTAAGASATSVALSWNSIPDATSFKIERSLDGTTFTTLAPASAGATSYTDTVTAATNYYYRISAVDAAGTSTATAVAHLMTVPATPVLTAALISATQINLTWPAVTGATSYRIDSSLDGTTWTPLIVQTTAGYNVTGLTSDTTYQFRVVAIDAGGLSAFSNATTALKTNLLAPAGFTATATASNNINLAWTAVTDAVTYKIDRSPDGMTWTPLAGATALSQSTVTFADTTVSGGTLYYYRIAAINTVGSSAESPTVSVLTVPATLSLTAAATSTSTVSLSWATVTGAHSYKIEKSANAGTNWTTLASPTALSYIATGLTADTPYEFRVSALNAAGASIASTAQSLTTPLVSPASFVGFSQTPTEIDLGWAQETDATGYKIERSADNVNWTTLAGSSALAGTDQIFDDTTVSPETNYFYRISSNSVGGYSAPTAPLHLLTLPAAPVQSGSVFSSTQINLSWSPVPTATGYQVQAATTANGSTTWANVNPQPVGTATSLQITGLTADSNYIYRVMTTNATGTGAVPQSAINLTTFLAAPTTFTAAATSSAAVTLSWDAISDATSFLLQRSANGGAFQTITPGTAWSSASAGYSDSGLTGGTTYVYKLSAIDAAGTSAASTATVLTKPSAPTLAGTATSATALHLTWAAVPSATSYTLQVPDGNGGWTTVNPGPVGTATSVNVTSLTADTSYTYQLIANNATGASVASNSLVISTILPAPVSFAAAPTTATSATLSFTAAPDAVSYVLQRSVDNAIWSTLTQTLGPTDASFTDTGLTAGTHYFYRMAAVNTAGTSAYSTANVTTLPVAPVLAGTVTSATSVNLTWNPVKSATSYTLKLSDGNGGWTTVSPGPVGAVTSFAITGLTADTAYTYELIANNGGASLASNSPTVTTTLAAPASLAATSPTATSVTLTWTAIADATSYLLQRSTNGTTWTTISQSLGSSDATFTDSSVLPDTSYTYRLSAIDAAGTSASSSTAILTLPAAPPLSIAVVSASSLYLSWPSSPSATGYTVNLGTTANGSTTWAAVNPGPTGTATSLTITGLTADTAYAYQVIATNGTGNSVAGTSATATTLLAAPAITATAASATTVNLAWTAIPDSTGYVLQRSINGVVWTTITPAPTGGSNTASYADTTAAAGTSYQYRLSAISASGTSAPSTAATVLTKPSAPVISGLTASASELDLSWTPARSATSYTLESSADGSTNWTAVSPAPVGTATSIAITGLTANTGYFYRVEAVNASGSSVSSNTLSISTLPVAPGTFAGTATASSVSLTWVAVSGASGYTIERSPDGINWAALNTSSLTGSSAAFTNSGVSPGTSYEYRISTVNSLGTSDPGTPITIITPLNAPTGLAATVNSASQITLNWNSDTDTGLTGFLLQGSTDGLAWSTVATLGPAAISAVDGGLTSATQYYFRLFAINAGGNSAATTPVTATTN